MHLSIKCVYWCNQYVIVSYNVTELQMFMSQTVCFLIFYQLLLILIALLHAVLTERCLSHGMCLYQVIMTLHFLNYVVQEVEST